MTLTGEGGGTYTLTDTADVEITSATEFTLTLSSTDKSNVNGLLNKDGANAESGTLYNLASADDWNGGASVADTGPNAVTASAATDSDNDGISTVDEDAGPNGGDSNGDGTQDYTQSVVAVVPDGPATSSITLQACDDDGIS